MGIQMVIFSDVLNSQKPFHLVLKYAIFAGISMLSNLGSQYIVDLNLKGHFKVYISMVIGTAIGLIVKYLLDRRYIFFFRSSRLGIDVKTFILYTFMGIITTAIFWGSELLLYFLIHTQEARYLGGFIGLLAGYTVKFLLDKRFVFKVQK